MKPIDVHVLRQAVQQLETLGADGTAECVIAAESSLSESILLGTSEGFIALSVVLLRLALADLSNDTAGEAAPDATGTRASDALSRLFYEFGSAMPCCAMVAPDKERYEQWKRKLIL